MSEKLCIISLDGLSVNDLSALRYLMPESDRHLDLNGFQVASTDARVHTSAQGTWAEFLTGAPWYENGCVGYAKLQDSLNKAQPFTELDFLVPPKLLAAADSPAESIIAINLPLLTAGTRTLLADGSIPSNSYVFPPQLALTEPFSHYVARPLINIAAYDLNPIHVIHHCIQIETQRLRCAETLFQRTNWTRFFYRVTLFDHLHHLLGLNFLRASDLLATEEIRSFVSQLDRFISRALQQVEQQTALVSLYSHVACREVLNLNRVFSRHGLMDFAPPIEQSRRARVLAPMLGYESSKLTYSSLDGRIKTDLTSVASPIAGAIYLNYKNRFSDGHVHPEESDQVLAQVRKILGKINVDFDSTLVVEEKKNETALANVPDFMVRIANVELHNMDYPSGRGHTTPRTMHSPHGFIAMRELKSKNSLTLIQTHEVLANSLAL